MPVKKKKEEELKPDYKGTSVMKEGNKEFVLGTQGEYVGLPEGIKSPKTFKITEGGQTIHQGGKTSRINLENRKVSSTDYFNSVLDAIDKTRVGRGEALMSLEEKNKYIIDSIINSPQNIGTPEYKQAVEEGRIQLGGRTQELAEQAQQLGQLTPEQKLLIEQEVAQVPTGFQKISLGQAATAGGVGAGIGAAGAAVPLGIASALAPATGGLSLLAGAGIVAGTSIVGFITAAYADIKQQQKGLVVAETLNVDRAITKLNNIISARNLGASAEETSLVYHQVVEHTYSSWVKLRLQTRGNALKAFEDGTKELEKFEIFFDPKGGTLETINLKMAQALVNPSITKISASDVGYTETEE